VEKGLSVTTVVAGSVGEFFNCVNAKKRSKMAKSNRVGFIGDTHSPVMLEGYPEWCMEVFDSWDVDRIIHIGDFVDWHAASRHESEVGYSDVTVEFEKAYVQVQHQQDVFGKKVECMLGNHDCIPSRILKSMGMPENLLRNENDLWDLEWTFYPRYHKLQIDDFQVMHGDQGRSSATPALAKATADWRSTVCGHHHTALGAWHACNESARYFGLSVGCGVDTGHAAMAYGKSFSKKGMIGCGVVIDGVPYAEPMPKKNKYGRILR
jgi:predicted phosphodiesterase